MATASVPPTMAKRMDEESRLLRQLESIDPTERWKARQHISNRNMDQFSNALVQQAQANARAMERQERQAQRNEIEFYSKKYRIIK